MKFQHDSFSTQLFIPNEMLYSLEVRIELYLSSKRWNKRYLYFYKEISLNVVRLLRFPAIELLWLSDCHLLFTIFYNQIYPINSSYLATTCTPR